MKPSFYVGLVAAGLVALCAAGAAGADPAPIAIDVSGQIEGRGLVLAESARPVFKVSLVGELNAKGEGKGALTLDVTPRPVDEFGFPEHVDAISPLRLECTLRLLKTKTFVFTPAGAPREEVTWNLYELTGPKITSKLTVAVEGNGWSYGRLVATDKDGRQRTALNLYPPPQPIPCHPGCFPPGTPIAVPAGTAAIESLRAGDVVTTVGADAGPGQAKVGQAKITSVFVTRNRLLEVRTEGVTLLTTTTQPLALAEGGLRAAGELQAGDKILIWDGRERRSAQVHAVAPTGRESRVYNLVLGEPVLFVAQGFLARSKPPGLPQGNRAQP